MQYLQGKWSYNVGMYKINLNCIVLMRAKELELMHEGTVSLINEQPL